MALPSIDGKARGPNHMHSIAMETIMMVAHQALRRPYLVG